MAFVFRAEKKEVPRSKLIVPGPGQYESQQICYQPDETQTRKKPFNSSVNRNYHSVPKEDTDVGPGPGSYNVTGDLLQRDKTQNLFFVPAAINENSEQVQATNVFKSKTKRTDTLINPELPGPGRYDHQTEFGKKYANYYKNVKSNNLQLVQDLIRKGKPLVPSIPSNVHSYGYTENDEHELMLNRNPIAQVQQYVGPGYYEPKKDFPNKYKGPAWYKSGAKKVDNFAKTTATTSMVGPGTYVIEGINLPEFKNKPNAGFASTTTRSFDAAIKQKLGFGKYQNRTPVSSQSEYTGRRISAMETDDGEDDDDEDEYIKDATPGPGHYHNESLISSFGTRNSDGLSTISGDRSRSFPKAVKPIAFGSSQRFKEQYTTTMEIGPGEYEVQPSSQKEGIKYTKVPFQSSNTRFDRAGVVSHPGPGSYNPPIDLLDRVKDKSKTGYVGSFGNTEKRFKISKLLEDTPGPGTYTSDTTKSNADEVSAAFQKGAHFFTSVTTRDPFAAKTDVPPPGSYNTDNLNIATKTQKNEEDSELPKRYPFNSGQARFEKPKEKPIPEDEDEDDDDDDEPKFGTSKNLESLLKSKTQPKSNAVFKSETMRKIGGVPKDQFPGPGAYHDIGQNPWNKRTFNIHFTGD